MKCSNSGERILYFKLDNEQIWNKSITGNKSEIAKELNKYRWYLKHRKIPQCRLVGVLVLLDMYVATDFRFRHGSTLDFYQHKLNWFIIITYYAADYVRVAPKFVNTCYFWRMPLLPICLFVHVLSNGASISHPANLFHSFRIVEFIPG